MNMPKKDDCHGDILTALLSYCHPNVLTCCVHFAGLPACRRRSTTCSHLPPHTDTHTHTPTLARHSALCPPVPALTLLQSRRTRHACVWSACIFEQNVVSRVHTINTLERNEWCACITCAGCVCHL
jgi:hypothetical protein